MTYFITQMFKQKLWKFGKLQDDGICLKLMVLVLWTLVKLKSYGKTACQPKISKKCQTEKLIISSTIVFDLLKYFGNEIKHKGEVK